MCGCRRDRAINLVLHDTLVPTSAEIVIIILIITTSRVKESPAAVGFAESLCFGLIHSSLLSNRVLLAYTENQPSGEALHNVLLVLSVSSWRSYRRIVVHAIDTFTSTNDFAARSHASSTEFRTAPNAIVLSPCLACFSLSTCRAFQRLCDYHTLSVAPTLVAKIVCLSICSFSPRPAGSCLRVQI